MYAAVRRFEGVTDSQKVVQVAKEGFVPIISQMPGFVAYYLVDAGDGVTVATSVFEHKDAEEQSTFVAGEFVGEIHSERWQARCKRAGAPESPGLVFALTGCCDEDGLHGIMD